MATGIRRFILLICRNQQAPGKKIAGGSPMGSVKSGPASTLMVPQKPALMHGVGQQEQLFRKASVPGAQKYGFVGKRNLKMSGNPSAHRLGSRSK